MNPRSQPPSTPCGATMTRISVRGLGCAAAALACAAAVSGCQFTGFGALPLPFTRGTGSGSYTVTAMVDQIGNLAPNSEVMVNNVPAGTVTAIGFDDWHAKLTISLPRSVRLPENATVTIGQKSLLGAEYVALAPPADAPPAGQLRGGDVIPLSRTSAYPSTEDVLAALSTVLNGGGLNQLSTITRELNNALNGHQQQARQLLANLSTFIDSLNNQRAAIVSTLGELNALSAQLKAGQGTLTTAIDGIPAGLKVLNDNEKNLTAALTALSNLSTVANRVINETSQNLLANLRSLQPALGRLADSGKNLADSITFLAAFPFPARNIIADFKGDYANVIEVLDLTVPKLEKAWLAGTPLASGAGTDKRSTKARNPFTTPLQLGSGTSGGSPSQNGKPGGSAPGSGSSGGGLGGVLGSILGGGGG
jgi:phospholipid/cholesterol/gamma-HCH transport system substrate-binding protein